MKDFKIFIIFWIAIIGWQNESFSQVVTKLDTITETTNDPFNQICYIETYRDRIFLRNRTYKSTGFLIAPNVILTAGHNLYSNKLSKVTNIKIVLGRYKENAAFDVIEIKGEFICQNTIIVHPNFKWNRINFDFGIVIIPDSVLENIANWPSTVSFKLDKKYELKIGDTLNVAGFPANNGYDGSLMTNESQICNNIIENKISHKFNTQTGNSGSPIWVNVNDERLIVGIHTYANSGTLLDKKHIELIQKWIEQKTIR
jgi:V8-like Glu-specific endopeptidase